MHGWNYPAFFLPRSVFFKQNVFNFFHKDSSNELLLIIKCDFTNISALSNVNMCVFLRSWFLPDTHSFHGKVECEASALLRDSFLSANTNNQPIYDIY